ncbi:MAG: hypothetical protein K0V04_45945 [Deltaproteobacteria bacterium]|nr:hypothetical protein [Deltaproteobacteria bacterium]
MPTLPIAVAHYGRNDPTTHVGGVETFARNLRLIFDEVALLHPGSKDLADWARRGAPIIYDNQTVLDWAPEVPVIGFQHGVAAIKATHTRTFTDRRLARAQAKASARRNTLWVACAQWIARTFDHLHGNGARHVVYHQVDPSRFDGVRGEIDPALLLHDARSEHKGNALIADLQAAFPQWKLEPLACKPHEVPDRMRRARGFIHLSRYEGNSIVCNEAMAMDLPCLFTRAGLMQDEDGPDQVHVIDMDRAFSDTQWLRERFAAFTESLETREVHPRQWVLEHAQLDVARASWQRVVDDFHAMT